MRGSKAFLFASAMCEALAGELIDELQSSGLQSGQRVFGQSWQDAVLELFGPSQSSFYEVDLENIEPQGTVFDPVTWTLTTDAFDPNHYQTAPYVANGYFGQALPSEGVGYWVEKTADGNWAANGWPLDQPRATFGTIAGFWNLQDKVKYVSYPPNVERGGESVISGLPDWTGLVVTTHDGESYLPGVNKESVKAYQQSSSLQNGIVHTNVTWKPKEDSSTIFQLNYTVLAHRTRVNLGLVRLDLYVNEAANFTLTDVLDGAGAIRAFFGDKAVTDDMIWTSVKPWGIENVTAYLSSTVKFGGINRGETSRITQSHADGTNHPWVSQNLSTVAQSWNISFKGPRNLEIYKYVGLASSDAFPKQTQRKSMSAAYDAKAMPWDVLVAEHTVAWDKTWDDADIEIPGNEELQIMARGSLFHLLTNSRPGTEPPGLGDNSIMVSGLSADSYAGLIFWDSDVWMYPSLLSLFPEHAMSINNYRTRLLQQGIENAQSYNDSGALFPWTSGRFGNCTGTGLCKGYQYHLNHDIAQSHWHYYLHTLDKTWLKEKGWPIIKNAADMFANYVIKDEKRGKYITKQMGEPDEFAYNIDNGAYTNAGIKMLLGDWAPAAANVLGIQIPNNWSVISENMEILYDENAGIIIEYEGMEGGVSIKQASVTLITYPLGWNINERQAQNDMSFYAAANSPDGPAMTWSMFAINEAQLQEQGCAAYTYLLRGYQLYLREPFYQFSEQASDNFPGFWGESNAAFPFLTGYGGWLQIFTNGFTGMRPKEDALFLDPMMVPQILEGIKVNGVKYQGAVLDIHIGLETTTINRRKADVSESPQPLTVRIGGKAPSPGDYTLEDGGQLIVPTRRPDVNGSAITGNMAQCRPITSDQQWVPGHLPHAAVDGSNATIWQPTSAASTSIVIDLESIRTIKGVAINWGNVPARIFNIYYRSEENHAWTEIQHMKEVVISQPWKSNEASLLKIRQGNETTETFKVSCKARHVKFAIEGTQGNDQSVGATIAEVAFL